MLYKARWDEVAAGEVVPQIVGLLGSPNKNIVQRALRALITIGPLARGALAAALPHLGSDDPHVVDTAAHAIGSIAWRDSDEAIGPLVAAFGPGHEKAVMFALLGFGPTASSAAPVFAQAFQHKSARIRRLALRGLKEIQAPALIIQEVLAQAQTDRSQEVRKYAQKLFPSQSMTEPRVAPGHPHKRSRGV